MATPSYEARKVGDTYKMVRVDTEHKVKVSSLAISGTLLAILGISRRGILGGALVAAGGACIYCGVSGQAPAELVRSLFSRPRRPDSETGPSYPHESRGRINQLPEDEVDEQAMESFPASDPPARKSVTRGG